MCKIKQAVCLKLIDLCKIFVIPNIGSTKVSSKLGVYKFTVFGQILAFSFKFPIYDYADEESQPC